MDPPISKASSGVKRPSLSPRLSSNAIKCPRHWLSPQQMMTVNDKMILYSTSFYSMFQNAVCDPQEMKILSSSILVALTSQLSINAEASTFPALTLIEAVALIDGFNEDELREWDAGLKKGFQEDNWRDLILIVHCTCQFLLKCQVGYNYRDSETSRCYDQDQEHVSRSTYRAP